MNITRKMLYGLAALAQSISYATMPALKVGDKVRVENGTLVPNP